MLTLNDTGGRGVQTTSFLADIIGEEALTEEPKLNYRVNTSSPPVGVFKKLLTAQSILLKLDNMDYLIFWIKNNPEELLKGYGHKLKFHSHWQDTCGEKQMYIIS